MIIKTENYKIRNKIQASEIGFKLNQSTTAIMYQQNTTPSITTTTTSTIIIHHINHHPSTVIHHPSTHHNAIFKTTTTSSINTSHQPSKHHNTNHHSAELFLSLNNVTDETIRLFDGVVSPPVFRIQLNRCLTTHPSFVEQILHIMCINTRERLVRAFGIAFRSLLIHTT